MSAELIDASAVFDVSELLTRSSLKRSSASEAAAAASQCVFRHHCRPPARLLIPPAISTTSLPFTQRQSLLVCRSTDPYRAAPDHGGRGPAGCRSERSRLVPPRPVPRRRRLETTAALCADETTNCFRMSGSHQQVVDRTLTPIHLMTPRIKLCRREGANFHTSLLTCLSYARHRFLCGLLW